MTRNTYQHAIAAIGCTCVLLSGCGSDGRGGEELRPLPDVTGMTVAQAEQRLERTNVSWSFKDDEGPEAVDFQTADESSGKVNEALADRRVVAQDPKPGFKVGSGDVILLKLRR